MSDRTGRATMEWLGRPFHFQLIPQSYPTLDGRSCTYLSHCVPLEAVLLLGTAAGLVLLE
ncbi:hypothetical protein TIFTF001_050579 [Ficus carica]|uniref:Uncharacterized protein n=1 Tax=Ficus carica TaxID=3494 RepID=A0AA87ZTB5_FICCA|nr:hypothetical protein TIFTF001_050579 [Ficus carica]